MPGHIKKSDGPDPDPSPWLMVSPELKAKLKAKPYDPKKSCWQVFFKNILYLHYFSKTQNNSFKSKTTGLQYLNRYTLKNLTYNLAGLELTVFMRHSSLFMLDPLPNLLSVCRDNTYQGCHIFLHMYNIPKRENIPSDHKIYQMDAKYS
jgi:hypothetical protein